MPSLSSILGTSRPSSGQSASSNSESQSFAETTTTTQPSRSTTASTTQSSSTPASTTPTPAATAAAAATSSIQLSDLQNILSGLSGKSFSFFLLAFTQFLVYKMYVCMQYREMLKIHT